MNKHVYDGDTIEVDGLTFRVNFSYEDGNEKPWEWAEGHGPVRTSNQSHRYQDTDKRPGERPLNIAGRNEYQFYYDWQEALKIAKRDGWNAEPYDAPNQALRAVQADFAYLRAYINDDWHYMTVRVVRIDAEGEEAGEPGYLGMVESWKDYHISTAYEMAEGLAEQARQTWRKAMHEARERKYWNSRDVMTRAQA